MLQADSLTTQFSGFFRDNPMLHPELPYRSLGEYATPVSYNLHNDDWVTGALIVCFLVLAFIINKSYNQLTQQTRDFFFAPKERTGLFAVETSFEKSSRLFIHLQLCLMCGLLSFVYAQQYLGLACNPSTSHLFLSLYTLNMGTYFLIKRLLSSFTNWIFFPKLQQKMWNDNYSYLITAESTLFFFFVLFSIYFNLSAENNLWIFLFLLLIIKILLTFKTFKIFFPKFYGCFHLFAYLCALELIPLLALWKSLVFITDNLIVKY